MAVTESPRDSAGRYRANHLGAAWVTRPAPRRGRWRRWTPVTLAAPGHERARGPRGPGLDLPAHPLFQRRAARLHAWPAERDRPPRGQHVRVPDRPALRARLHNVAPLPWSRASRTTGPRPSPSRPSRSSARRTRRLSRLDALRRREKHAPLARSWVGSNLAFAVAQPPHHRWPHARARPDDADRNPGQFSSTCYIKGSWSGDVAFYVKEHFLIFTHWVAVPFGTPCCSRDRRTWSPTPKTSPAPTVNQVSARTSRERCLRRVVLEPCLRRADPGSRPSPSARHRACRAEVLQHSRARRRRVAVPQVARSASRALRPDSPSRRSRMAASALRPTSPCRRSRIADPAAFPASSPAGRAGLTSPCAPCQPAGRRAARRSAGTTTSHLLSNSAIADSPSPRALRAIRARSSSQIPIILKI